MAQAQAVMGVIEEVNVTTMTCGVGGNGDVCGGSGKVVY